MVRLRKKPHQIPLTKPSADPQSQDKMPESRGLRVGAPGSWSVRTQWIFFAVASGACAAFNGVFAKLSVELMKGSGCRCANMSTCRTTTGLTTSLSQSIADALGLSDVQTAVEYVIRGVSHLLTSKASKSKYHTDINTDVLCPEPHLQRRHVVPLHYSAGQGHIHHPSFHHEHLGKFHSYSSDGLRHFQ